jgi:hypothetical protein
LGSSVLALICCSSFVHADDPDLDPAELLSRIAQQYQSNYDALTTWQGRAEIESFSSRSEPLNGDLTEEQRHQVFGSDVTLYHQHMDVEFLVDLRSDMLFSSYQHAPEVAYVDEVNGARVSLRRANPHHRVAILLSDIVLYVDPGDRYGSDHSLYTGLATRPGGNRMVRCNSSEYGREFTIASNIFDPRRLFEHGGWTIAELCRRRSGYHRSGEFPVAVERTRTATGDVDGFEFSWVYANGETTRMFFKQHGDKLLLERDTFSAADGEAEWLEEFSYQLLEDGVFIPVRFENEHRDSQGRTVYRRVVTITESVINEPIDSDAFEITAMGVEDGDRVVDEISDEIWIINDGQLVEPDEYLIEHPMSDSQ